MFLAKYNFGHRPAHALSKQQTLTKVGGQERRLELSINTITAGKLAFQVIAVREAGALISAHELPFVFEGKGIDAITEMWPLRHNLVNWPPAAVMNHEDIDRWSAM